ncbi:MAG: hypothetical protein IJT15_00280 [Rickettsiales bacterium]|nr:hypothetical protein [Rickettsiales bacterium]
MLSPKSTAPNKTPPFFLTFAMKNFDPYKGGLFTGCPLDNSKISNGYIKAEGKMSYSLTNSDGRKYKCFTLHPVIENKDITPYDYGNIGYDLNADSMKIYAGGWNDLSANNNGNKIINNIQTLDTDGKKGHLYLNQDGKVHLIMLNKVVKRAELLKKYAYNYSPSNNNGSIFENNSCDASFTSDNYDIEVDKSESSNQQNNSTNNRFIIKQKELNEQSKNEVKDFYDNYGLSPYECFKLTYDKDNNEFTLPSNELNGVPQDANKGIKVDRIFVKKSVLNINSGYWTGYCSDKDLRQLRYDNYMKNIADVLVENFPDGEIRIIYGQNFEIIPTRTFIEKYIPEEYRKDYLDKLDSKLDSICSNIDDMQSSLNIEIKQKMNGQDQQKVPATENTNNKTNEYNGNKNNKDKQVEEQQSNHADRINPRSYQNRTKRARW